MARLQIPVSEREILQSMEGHAVRNRELLALIQGKAIGLAEPRLIDLFFWSATEATANALAAELTQRGFEAPAIEAPVAEGLWSVQVQASKSPENVAAGRFTEEMVRLAARHSSDFDGWGTEIDEA